MTSPIDRRTARFLLIAAAAASMALAGAGCQKKKKPAPPPPPPPKPVAVIAPPVDIGAVLQQMKADARVQFADNQIPADRTLAEGIVKLADSLAKGDANGIKAVLTPQARTIVDELVATGGWDDTKNIEQVRVVSVSGTIDDHAQNSSVAMAIQGKDGAYLLAWAGTRNGDSWTFQNAPCQDTVKTRAREFDGVAIGGGFDLAAAKQGDEIADTGKPGGTAGAAPGSAPGTPASSPDSVRKNTPFGPVNVPQKTPGGG
jgi:hypothetical protein